MGIYVEYRPCEPDGPLEQLSANLRPFVEWYTTDFSEDGDSDVLDLSMNLLETGVSGLARLPVDTYPVFDRLVSEFYGFYCDTGGRGLPPHAPCGSLHVRRYRRLHDDLAGHVPERCATLWSYIYRGRPIAPPGTTRGYVSDDDSSWVSWWSLEEVKYLRQNLPSAAFGAGETEWVLECAHCALDHAESLQSGLVVTAF